MSKVLEQLIARGRRERKPMDQRQVAFSLAEISTNPELHEKMIEKGIVISLVKLIQSQDIEATRFACLCLANIASTASTRLSIVNDGALSTLIKVLRYKNNKNNIISSDIDEDNPSNSTTSDLIAKQYVAMAIGNLAAEPETHEEIVKLNGIPALIQLIDPEEIQSGVYAAFAISNLSVNNEYRPMIIDENAVPLLISLACSSDKNAQRQALAALRGICISPKYRLLVIKEGILDPLILMARSNDIDIRREVAAAFSTLSCMEENKLEITERSLLTILSMALSDDPDIEQHACCTLANLMEMTELHEHLLRENGLPSIVALSIIQPKNTIKNETNELSNNMIEVQENNSGTRAEACRCIANLSTNINFQIELMKKDVLESMLQALMSMDHVCQRYAALTIANLSSITINQIRLVQIGILGPLIKLAQSFDRELEARRYAVLAIANLAATIANHVAIIEENALLALFSLASSADNLSQYYVIYALANLSSNVDNHIKMVEEGGLQPIISLASHPNIDIHHQAIAALRGLAVNNENKIKIIQEGGLEPLCYWILNSNSLKDIEILRDICGCFCNLSLSDENKYEIAKSKNCILSLIKYSQSQDMEISCQSCATLANLCEMQENQLLIGLNEGIPSLINSMRSPYIEVQREAGRCIANLSALILNHDIICDSGGHHLLTSYLLSPDMASQRVGALGLNNLSTNPKMQKLLIKEAGAMDPLMSLARSEDVEIEIQRYCILAIANVCSCVENHEIMCAEGILPLLISLANVPDEQVRQYAAFAIVKIAINADLRNKILQEGGLEPILYLSRTENIQDIYKDLLPAICTLSFTEDDTIKYDIIHYGGLHPLINGITSNDSSVQRQACCGIANLCENIENQHILVKNNVIDPLINALKHSIIDVQRESARALGNLSINIEYGELIFNKNILDSLLLLFNSNIIECQRMAGMCLANLATNIKNQSKMLQSSNINNIIDTSSSSVSLSSSTLINKNTCNLLDSINIILNNGLDPRTIEDNELIRYSLLIIANLSVSIINHKEIINKCIHYLSNYLKHRDVKCRQYTMFIVGNLCSNSDNISIIIENNILKSIISFTFPGDINVQFQAISGLRGISIHSTYCPIIIQLGALEPLIIGINNNENIEILREISALLCNLSLHEENKITMARSGIISGLIKLASSKDTIREMYSIMTIGNILEMLNGQTHRKLIDEGILNPLILIASNYHPNNILNNNINHMDNNNIPLQCIRQVARCFALLSAKNESQLPLLRINALKYIIKFATSDTNPNNNDKNNNGNHDIILQRYGILTIANLSVQINTHKQLFDDGAMIPIINNNSNDIETRRCVAFGLNNIASNETNHSLMYNKNNLSNSYFLKQIISLIKEKDHDTHLQGCFALKKISYDSKIRNYLVSHYNILEPLFQLINHTTNNNITNLDKYIILQREIAAILRNLSLSEDNKLIIGQHYTYGIIILIDLIHSTDEELVHQICGLLANLAELAENQSKLIKTGIIPHLKFILKSMNNNTNIIEIQREAIRTIANLCAEYSCINEIISTGGYIALINNLISCDYLTIRFCTMGLANLTTSIDNQNKIILNDNTNNIDLISKLIELADHNNNNNQDNDIDTQKYALYTLTNLAYLRENHILLNENNKLIPLFIRLLTNNNDFEIRNAAVFGLANFAAFTENHEILLQDYSNNNHTSNNLIYSLILLLNSQDPKTQLRAVSTLRGLSINEKNRMIIIKNNGIKPLLLLTKSNNIDVQQEVLACLCNLSLTGCIGANPELFINNLEIQNLIHFLCSADSTYRLFGAVMIGNIVTKKKYQDILLSTNPTLANSSNINTNMNVTTITTNNSNNNGILKPLINLSNMADLETQRSIALGLCNIASDIDKRQLLVEKGALPSIISLACNHDNINDMKIAISALRGLANTPENRIKMIKEGVLEPLILCGKKYIYDNIDLLKEIIVCCYNLSLAEENKIQMVKTNQFLQFLIILINNTNLFIVKYAAATLANICENHEVHDIIVKTKGIMSSLIDIYKNQNNQNIQNNENNQTNQSTQSNQNDENDLIKEKIRCLSNLSSNIHIHEYLFDFDFHLVLGNKILNYNNNYNNSNNNDILLYACIAFNNICTNHLNHVKILKIDNLSQKLYTILNMKYNNKLNEKNNENIPSQYILLALGCLFNNILNHIYFIQNKEFSFHLLLTSIIHYLDYDHYNMECKFNAIFVLSKLSTNEESHLLINELQVISKVIDYINNTEVTSHGLAQGISIIRHLAKTKICAITTVLYNNINNNITNHIHNKHNHTIIQGLIKSIELKIIENERESMGCLCYLTLYNETKYLIGCGNKNKTNHLNLNKINDNIILIHLISKLIESNDIEIARNACGTLANIVQDIDTHDYYIYYKENYNMLIVLMKVFKKTKILSIYREILRFFSNFFTTIENQELFLIEDKTNQSNNNMKLIHTICYNNKINTNYDMESQYSISIIYHKLSTIINNHQQLLEFDYNNKNLNNHLTSKFTLLYSLFHILDNENNHDLDIKKQACAAFKNLSCNIKNKNIIYENNIWLKIIISLLNENDIQLLALSTCTLRHLVLYHPIKTAFGISEGLNKLIDNINLLFDINPTNNSNNNYNNIKYYLDYQVQNTGALANLSDLSQNQVIICQKNGLNAIVNIMNRLIEYNFSKYNNETNEINNFINEIYDNISRCIANVSSHPDNQINIFNLEIFTCIFYLINLCNQNKKLNNNQTIEITCQNAVMALGNLSITSKNQSFIVKQGGFIPLINILSIRKSDTNIYDFLIAKEYAARVIYRLATLSENQDKIIQSGILNSLLSLLDLHDNNDTTDYLKIKTNVAMALCNLSLKNENGLKIAKVHGIDSLLSLIKDCISKSTSRMTSNNNNNKYLECTRYAILTLCNLAQNTTNQLLIAKSNGCLELLINTLNLSLLNSSRSNDKDVTINLYIDISKNIAMLLANLSSHRQNRESIVISNGLQPLFTMCNTSILELQRSSVLTIYNLSCASLNQLKIMEYKTLISCIVALINNDFSNSNQLDFDVIKYSFMILCNLTANSETRVSVAKAGGLQACISGLKYNNSNNNNDSINIIIKRYACIALCNLCWDPIYQVQTLVHGGYIPLLNLLTSLQLKNKNKIDIEAQRFSIMTINNLAANESNHEILLTNNLNVTNNVNLLKIIVNELCCSNESDIRQYAAFTLANFAGNPEYSNIIGKEGGIIPLIALSSSTDLNIQALAFSALRRICLVSYDNRAIIIRGGGLQPLNIAGFKPEIELQMEVAGLFYNLSLSDEYKIEIVQSTLPSIILLCQSKDPEVCRQACGAIANLSERIDTHLYFYKNNASKFLIGLLNYNNNSLDIHREAARAISNLLSSFFYHKDMIENGLIGLIKLGLSQDIECQYNVGMAFRKLAPNFTSHYNIIYNEGLKTLFCLLLSKNNNIKRQAITALRDLASNDEHKIKYMEEGGINALITFVRDNNNNTKNIYSMENIIMQSIGMATLRHLSINKFTKRPMIESGILRPLFHTCNIYNNNIFNHSLTSALTDLTCQCTGLLANLSENMANQISIVEETGTVILCKIYELYNNNNEIQQDIARTLANLSSNEENHLTIFKQGGLTCLFKLTIKNNQLTSNPDITNSNNNNNNNNNNINNKYDDEDDICQRYAAMGLRFLSSNPEIRIYIIQQNYLQPFIILSQSKILDYQRTAAAAFSSFSLNEENRLKLVRDGGLISIINLGFNNNDLQIKRDIIFAFANICDSLEYQEDIIKENGIYLLVEIGLNLSNHENNNDIRIVRDIARSFTSLSMSKEILNQILQIDNNNNNNKYNNLVLKCLFKLLRSLDMITQRYIGLTLTNFACITEWKIKIITEGGLRPLIYLARLPDIELQKYAALCFTGLALGDHNNNKIKMIEEGVIHPLIEMLRFPDLLLQKCSILAINSFVLGKKESNHNIIKTNIMQENGLLPILSLINNINNNDIHLKDEIKMDCIRLAIYCLGSLAESELVCSKLVELGTLPLILQIGTLFNYNNNQVDIEILRYCGYFCSLIVESIEYHDDYVRENGMIFSIHLAGGNILNNNISIDIESQEYGTFILAHLSSNRDYQVLLVENGVLKPLISILAIQSEPRHYASLALLKLADNFENHIRIAEEGGIQALLKIARTKNNDVELQYKATLSVGQLASNATKLLPKNGKLSGNELIGKGTLKMAKLTETLASKTAKKETNDYFINNN